MKRAVGERRHEVVLQDEGRPVPSQPGDGGGGLPRHAALQHRPRAVGEGEGGRGRDIERGAIALSQQNYACTVTLTQISSDCEQPSQALLN